MVGRETSLDAERVSQGGGGGGGGVDREVVAGIRTLERGQALT